MENADGKGVKKKLFRDKSIQELSSPENLKEYIRVTDIRVWLVLAAVFCVLIGLLIWAFLGSITVTKEVNCVVSKGEVIGYVADPSGIDVGMEVIFDGLRGKVTNVAEKPVSREELSSMYEAYILYALNAADYAYEVRMDVPGASGGVLTATVVTERVRPISFLLGGGNEE